MPRQVVIPVGGGSGKQKSRCKWFKIFVQSIRKVVMIYFIVSKSYRPNEGREKSNYKFSVVAALKQRFIKKPHMFALLFKDFQINSGNAGFFRCSNTSFSLCPCRKAELQSEIAVLTLGSVILAYFGKHFEMKTFGKKITSRCRGIPGI